MHPFAALKTVAIIILAIMLQRHDLLEYLYILLASLF
jgi:hypothetical protein